MNQFNVGDRVEILDDTLSGVITAISGIHITVETEMGFQIKYSSKELIKIDSDRSITVSNYEVNRIKKEKEQPKPKDTKKDTKEIKPKERNIPKMEVDLHIDQLVKSSKGMSNFDILDLQLKTAEHQLDFAIKKRIQKIVFIHGTGKGVLKKELSHLFNRYDNLKFYNADYQKYGAGATEVYIFQSYFN